MLTQFSSFTFHVYKNLLKYFSEKHKFSREAIILVETAPISDCYLSDHYRVLCNLVLRKPAFSVKEVSYRKVKGIDINAFRKDLQQSD